MCDYIFEEMHICPHVAKLTTYKACEALTEKTFYW